MIVTQTLPVLPFAPQPQPRTPNQWHSIPAPAPTPHHHHHHLFTCAIQSTSTTSKTTSSSNSYVVVDDFQIITELKTPHNHIRVVDIPRHITGHPLAGARLLLLDTPGNIHSISFPHLPHPLTSTYFDVFATVPPILPSGPVAILGFGAGSAAKLLYHYHQDIAIHGYELDDSVIAVAREFFHLAELEALHEGKLFVHVDDAFRAEVEGGFAGVLVDLFAKGSVIPELQDVEMWEVIARKLREGGRVMVNCGGACVEAEEKGRDGDEVKEETLKAMVEVFGAGNVFVLNLGSGKEEDNWMAVTGRLPEDLAGWKRRLPPELHGYVDMWKPYTCNC